MKITGLSASEQIICYDAKCVDAGLLHGSYRKGYFFLKNGSISPYPVYNQEFGVFIDQHLFIPLKMSKKMFTAREAKIYFKTLGAKIPDFYQIVRLKLALENFNSALEQVGMKDFVLPSDVLDSVWYEEALESYHREEETRRCVVISEYDNYQKPCYQEFNNSCLLFDNSFLYKRTVDCYEPISPVLVFSWFGIDFFRATIDEKDYLFYRGKENKLIFLGIDCDIEILNHELIHISNNVYQSHEGKLYELCYACDSLSYHYDDATKRVSISYEDEYVMGVIPESRWREYIYFQKDENGLLIEVERKNITTYERSVNY